MNKIPKKCPACNANLNITRLSCPDCGTEVTGSFTPDLFSRLSSNDYDFVVLFLKTKGNIKEMERELGISYWTIRSKLNEIVEQLGFGASETEEAPLSREADFSNRRQAILDQLNSGQLTVQEAAALLEQMKRRNR
jgi:hypothetical protein